MNKTNNNPVDCFKCKYMFITWDESSPRGCSAFGFKSKKLPSVVVQEASGESCYKYTPKPLPPSPKKKDGWIA